MCGFFFKFVGGDSARDTIPVLRALRAENKGALLVYSVEVDDRAAVSTDSNNISGQGNAPHKRFVEEMIRAVDTVADFEDSLGNPASFSRRTCVALKLVRLHLLLDATSCWFTLQLLQSALLPDTHALIKLSRHILKSRSSRGAQVVLFPGSPTPSDLEVLYGEYTPLMLLLLMLIRRDQLRNRT
jgi:proline dehydrogenase